MADKQPMIEFLEDFSRPKPGRAVDAYAKLILSKGVWFEGRVSSDVDLLSKVWKEHRKPQQGQCFYNAQMFCSEFRCVRYFEGFAGTNPGASPVRHAWNILPD